MFDLWMGQEEETGCEWKSKLKRKKKQKRWVCLCEMSRLWPQWRKHIQSCVRSFWTSTKHHFLPSLSLETFMNVNQQEGNEKSHSKNIKFAFRCLPLNDRLKTIIFMYWESKARQTPPTSPPSHTHEHYQVTSNKKNTQTGELLSCQVHLGALHLPSSGD